MKDTICPKVTVKLPEVKLKLEDITYLRSLSGDQKISCYPKAAQENRLMVLGLIEEGEIQPLASEVAEADKEISEYLVELRQLLDENDLEGLSNWNNYDLRRQIDAKRPKKGKVLTEVGRELLEKSEVVTRITKLGCL
jgi:hypothetical protein